MGPRLVTFLVIVSRNRPDLLRLDQTGVLHRHPLPADLRPAAHGEAPGQGGPRLRASPAGPASQGGDRPAAPGPGMGRPADLPRSLPRVGGAAPTTRGPDDRREEYAALGLPRRAGAPRGAEPRRASPPGAVVRRDGEQAERAPAADRVGRCTAVGRGSSRGNRSAHGLAADDLEPDLARPAPCRRPAAMGGAAQPALTRTWYDPPSNPGAPSGRASAPPAPRASSRARVCPTCRPGRRGGPRPDGRSPRAPPR